MMNGDAPDEYELADQPEPEASEDEPTPTPGSKLPGAPGQPLPRMWKSEPDEDEAPPKPARSRAKAPDEPAPAPRRRASAEPTSTGRKTGLKPKPELDENGEKKVLKEDTPVLDTYETRQRVRLATSAMLAFVVALGCYIVYNVFLYDPFPMGPLPPDEGYVVEASPGPPKVDLDFEAQAMLARARESAKNGRTDEAVALLDQLTKAYKNTRTAAEAEEALKRPSQNLPLFLEGPTVAASPAPVSEAQPIAPPVMVEARPSTVDVRGNASLVPPANPPETIAPPVAETPAAAQAVSPGETPDRRLPAGFAAKAEAGTDPSGWPLVIVGDRDGAPLVFVPGGIFTQGEDRDPQFAAPAHKVRLSAYYIDQHEVTVGQFRRFLAETRYRGRPTTTWPQVDEKDKSAMAMPMIMVTHADALAFAEWAGKTLPTEAQWEAAARTTDGRIYPWGDEPAKYARKRAPRQVDPVMSFSEDKSPYEVFDLAGNVMEWTADSFERGYYQSLAGQVVDDPAGPQGRGGRGDVVVKGGKVGAASSREPINPDKRLGYVGFRCAIQVERAAPPVAPAATTVTAPAAPNQPAANPSTPATKGASAPVEPF